MDVSISEHWVSFVEDAVKDGRFGSISDVIEAGLRLVEQNEAKLRSLRETLEVSIARGGSFTDEEVGLRLASRHKRRSLKTAAE